MFGMTPVHSRSPSWENKFMDTKNAGISFEMDDTTPRKMTFERRGSETTTEWMGNTIRSSKLFLRQQLARITTPSYDVKSPTSDNYLASPNEKAIPGRGLRNYGKVNDPPSNSNILYQLRRGISNLIRPSRRSGTLLLCLCVIVYLFSKKISSAYRSNRFLGGGSKYVIILAANQGGGVLNWKGADQWAVERLSVQNKKDYAARHGYTLEIRDSKSLKRYAHEWRESWEKVDVVRQSMRKYPKAEWFWYLDLHTFIMEPEVSLESHIFNRLAKVTYRDINVYNPLNIPHPLTQPWLDETAKQKNGDGKTDSIKLIVPQDCGGFNLGSFFARRSEFTDRLMDVWWDPVGYEQKHQDWEHKEQDVLVSHPLPNQPSRSISIMINKNKNKQDIKKRPLASACSC